MGVYTLRNTIQRYDWGSVDWIPSLLGVENPEKKPMAELWMGAHPSAPSRVVLSDGETLLPELIEKDPRCVLGERVFREFGGKLPFLFKVLAAEKPLSIQAHPDKRQAEKGFERENRDGIPLDAYERNYKDDNHKPELIVAVTDFFAMRGFRRTDEIISECTSMFSGMDHSLYIPEKKNRLGEEKEELKRFFQSVMDLSGVKTENLINRAMKTVAERGDGDALHYTWMKKLQETYPGDVGVLCPLFLNVLCLRPGEGMFLPAGELHAYLHGLGIEIMANSDNVLRGGCTSKHIARDELLSVLRFESGEPEVLRPKEDEQGEANYPSPVSEFNLSTIRLNGSGEYNEEAAETIQILLCAEGNGTIRPQIGSAKQLRKGQSVVITADTGYYSLSGRGMFYKATAG